MNRSQGACHVCVIAGILRDTSQGLLRAIESETCARRAGRARPARIARAAQGPGI